MGNLTKSKERVRKHAEVFTPIHIVKKMLDLLESEESETDVYALGKTWLEPTCGNGVFIGEIVQKKLRNCESIEQGMNALKDVYAIDIQPDNIQQAQCQALGQFVRWCIERELVVCADEMRDAFRIIERNFIIGDFLKQETIKLYDWKAEKFVCLADMKKP